MKPGQTVRFQSLPVGAVFSCPDPSWSPLRVKLNETSAGDYPPGPMGPGQPSYHFTGLEWCLVRERRTGPEDRRMWTVLRGEFKGVRGGIGHKASGRRAGDLERAAMMRQAAGRTHRGDALEFGLKVEVGPELRSTMILGEVSQALDNHFGEFRRKDIESIPEQVAQVCADSRARLRDAGARGQELQEQQRRMAAVRSALNLPIGDPVEAIKGLQKQISVQDESIGGMLKALRSHEANFDRLREDSMTATREKNALEEQATRLRDRINALEGELHQTKTRMWRERWRYKMEQMGRPTGIGPTAFQQACAAKFNNADLNHFTTCPWKFRTDVEDSKQATGRTTRMLTAALDAMIDGEKVLVCGAGSDWKRLLQQAEQMLRKRVQSYTTNTTLRELSCPPFPGRVRFAVLPPPVQVERIERDLARGDILVDHFAVERLFSILTATDGRSTAMLRLAYPNLAAQLDR